MPTAMTSLPEFWPGSMRERRPRYGLKGLSGKPHYYHCRLSALSEPSLLLRPWQHVWRSLRSRHDGRNSSARLGRRGQRTARPCRCLDGPDLAFDDFDIIIDGLKARI